MNDLSFAQYFFRIYDRKINSGEISFGNLGLPKEEFNKLCSDGSYVFNRELMEKLILTMGLSEEESNDMLSYLPD